jgi:serine protease
MLFAFFISIKLTSQNQIDLNEVLVQTKSINIQRIQSKLSKNLIKTENISNEFNLWKLSFGKAFILSEIIALKNEGLINSFIINRPLFARNTLPNDTFFSQQWHHKNDTLFGQNFPTGINSIDAWDFNKSITTLNGDTIVVAVVDFGFDSSHQDLDFYINRQEIPNNNQDDDNNGAIDDYRGWDVVNNKAGIDGTDNQHGTAACGGIAALGNNKIGVAGVAWNCKLLPINIGPKSGGNASIESAIKTLEYCYRMKKMYLNSNKTKGAYIVAVNFSLGTEGIDPLEETLWCSIIDYLGNVGILTVVAASNNSNSSETLMDMPVTCNSAYQINVTTYNNSTFGLDGASYSKKFIHLAAPHKYYSTLVENKYGVFKNGTSFAAPIVSGTIALMYSNFSNKFLDSIVIQPERMTARIKATILENVDATAGLKDKVVSDGKINLYKTIKAATMLGRSSYIQNKTILDDLLVNYYLSNNKLKILNNSHSPIEFKLYNILGQNLINKSLFNMEEEIDLSMLNSNILFLEFRQRDKTQLGKIHNIK